MKNNQTADKPWRNRETPQAIINHKAAQVAPFVVDLATNDLEDTGFSAFLKAHEIGATVVGRLRGAPYSDIVRYTGPKAAIEKMAAEYWDMPQTEVSMLSFFTPKTTSNV